LVPIFRRGVPHTRSRVLTPGRAAQKGESRNSRSGATFEFRPTRHGASVGGTTRRKGAPENRRNDFPGAERQAEPHAAAAPGRPGVPEDRQPTPVGSGPGRKARGRSARAGEPRPAPEAGLRRGAQGRAKSPDRESGREFRGCGISVVRRTAECRRGRGGSSPGFSARANAERKSPGRVLSRAAGYSPQRLRRAAAAESRGLKRGNR
jgi:hypothetical protein